MKSVLAIFGIHVLVSGGLRAQEDPARPEDRKVLDAQAGEFFNALRPAVAAAAEGVVEVWVQRKHAAYGTVVAPGKVLTKWSEVAAGQRNLSCRARGGDWLAASLVGVYPEADLAVLAVEGLRAKPLSMAREEPLALGSFLVLARPDGEAGAMGVVSVLPRSLRESDRAFLGVQMDLAHQGPGVKVDRVEAGSGAEKAGLRPGDIVTAVGAMNIEGSFELSTALQRLKPGEEAEVTYQRGASKETVSVVLAGRPSEGRVPRSRMDQMNRMGGHRYSGVSDDFREVIQTDMQLVPEDCGAPVVGLDGDLAGIAIARAGRIKSFVVPVGTLREMLEREPVEPGAAELAQRPEPGPEEPPLRPGTRETMRRHIEDMRRLMKELEESGR